MKILIAWFAHVALLLTAAPCFLGAPTVIRSLDKGPVIHRVRPFAGAWEICGANFDRATGKVLVNGLAVRHRSWSTDRIRVDVLPKECTITVWCKDGSYYSGMHRRP